MNTVTISGFDCRAVAANLSTVFDRSVYTVVVLVVLLPELVLLLPRRRYGLADRDRLWRYNRRRQLWQSAACSSRKSRFP